MEKIINLMQQTERQTHAFASDMWKRWEDSESSLRQIANAKDASADELRAMAAQASHYLRR